MGRIAVLGHPVTGKTGRDVIHGDNSFSTEPRVGLHPLELWQKGSIGETYAGNHPGSRIVSIDTSFTNSRFPEMAGCVHVSLSASL